jgi:hypothetical protein
MKNAKEIGLLFSPDAVEWHHWMMDVRRMIRNIQRARRVSTGTRMLCSVVLGLFLVTVHAPHLSEPQAHMAMGDIDHVLAPTSHGEQEQSEAIDCPFPDLVPPQISALFDQPVLGVWFTAMLPLALLASYVVCSHSSPARFPRPPGPTRQAVLQRFTL